MTTSAPRIDSRLVAAAQRLDRTGRAISDVNRAAGEVADALKLTRPSYEQVRVIVHELRSECRHPGVGELLLELAFSTRPKPVILKLLDGPPGM